MKARLKSFEEICKSFEELGAKKLNDENKWQLKGMNFGLSFDYKENAGKVFEVIYNKNIALVGDVPAYKISYCDEVRFIPIKLFYTLEDKLDIILNEV